MDRASKIASFFLFPAVIFLVHTVVKLLGLYETFPAIDIPFHYLGGLSIAYTCAQVLSYLESERVTAALHRGIFLVLLLSLTATVAVFWEFAEFISDQLLATNLQPSIANTMQDQFLGILGGGTWAFIYFKRGVSKIGNNMSFYRRTPVRCERLKGVTLAPGASAGENPCGFEPFGSNPQETLRIRSG